jgi:hypothetical protein
VLVEVTQEDIDKGKRGDPWCCPAARALERATGKKWSVVGPLCSRVDDRKQAIGKRITLPQEVFDFVRAFDGGEPVSPFSFELEV